MHISYLFFLCFRDFDKNLIFVSQALELEKRVQNEVFSTYSLGPLLSRFEDEQLPEALINNIPSFLTPWHFHILVGSIELAAREPR